MFTSFAAKIDSVFFFMVPTFHTDPELTSNLVASSTKNQYSVLTSPFEKQTPEYIEPVLVTDSSQL